MQSVSPTPGGSVWSVKPGAIALVKKGLIARIPKLIESLRRYDRRLPLRVWDGCCNDKLIDLDFSCTGRRGYQRRRKGDASERFTRMMLTPPRMKLRCLHEVSRQAQRSLR